MYMLFCADALFIHIAAALKLLMLVCQEISAVVSNNPLSLNDSLEQSSGAEPFQRFLAVRLPGCVQEAQPSSWNHVVIASQQSSATLFGYNRANFCTPVRSRSSTFSTVQSSAGPSIW
jgi:hypothetical protein